MPGHTEKRKGASNEYTTEFDLALIVCSSVISQSVLYKSKNDVMLYRETDLNYGYKDINNLNADLIIQLHFNSHKSSLAKGYENLYHYKSRKGKQCASDLQGFVKSFYCKIQGKSGAEGLDRGTKHVSKGKRGYAFLNKTKAPAVIMEPFFLSTFSQYTAFMRELPFFTQMFSKYLSELTSAEVSNG